MGMDCTIDSYSLIENHLPNIPVPHDCVITEISLQDAWLMLSFENDISLYDSIQSIHPDVRTLVMKIYLVDEEDIELLAHEKRKYETVYVERKPKRLFDLAKKSWQLEYLYHKVAYGSIQLELCGDTYYIVRLYADRVIMEWRGR